MYGNQGRTPYSSVHASGTITIAMPWTAVTEPAAMPCSSGLTALAAKVWIDGNTSPMPAAIRA
ncbi:hypothetical protein D3C71_2030530 [compost metagenome]